MNFDYIEKSDFFMSLAHIYVSLCRLMCTEYKLGQTLVDKILSGHLLESMATARVKTDLSVSYVDHNNE